MVIRALSNGSRILPCTVYQNLNSLKIHYVWGGVTFLSLEKKLLMMLFAITCGNLFCSFRVYHFLSLHNHYSVIAGSLYNPLNINNFLEEGTWNNVLLSDLLLHLKSPKGIEDNDLHLPVVKKSLVAICSLKISKPPSLDNRSSEKNPAGRDWNLELKRIEDGILWYINYKHIIYHHFDDCLWCCMKILAQYSEWPTTSISISSLHLYSVQHFPEVL